LQRVSAVDELPPTFTTVFGANRNFFPDHLRVPPRIRKEMEFLTQISSLHRIHGGRWRAKEFSVLEVAGAMAKWEG
jgi:hypothetical protein